MRRVTQSYLLAGAALVAWACAKANEADPGGGSYEATGGTGASGGSAAAGGSGGSSAQPGSGGTLPATGGSSATGGNGAGGTAATGGVGGAAGTGGSSAAGGSSATAGRSASGGMNATGGTTGGMNATGGTTGGANPTGGSGGATGGAGGAVSAGGNASGVMGMAGIPNDPNWKPPDMSAAKLSVLYQVQQKETMTYSIGMMLQLKNMSGAAYDLSKVTIRYWFSSEAAPMPRFDYTAQGLSAASAPTFVSNMANSYVQMSFKAGGTVPVYVDQNSLNNTNMSVAVQAQSNTGQFSQSNDWSFDATSSAYKANPKITVYDGTTLIWGCEPSHLCADTTAAGDAGASGM